MLFTPNMNRGSAGACPWWIAGLLGGIVVLAVAFVILSCHVKLLRRALFPFRDRVAYSPQINSPASSPRLSASLSTSRAYSDSYTERNRDYRRTYLPPPSPSSSPGQPHIANQ
jgi:hypothetical protein